MAIFPPATSNGRRFQLAALCIALAVVSIALVEIGESDQALIELEQVPVNSAGSHTSQEKRG